MKGVFIPHENAYFILLIQYYIAQNCGQKNFGKLV